MRLTVLAAVVGLFATLVAPAAGAQSGQEESGTAYANLPSPNGPDNDCFQGYGRRVYVISQGTVNHVLGSMFEVDEATWGGKFKLEGKGITGNEDLDLYFYSFLGDVVQDPSLNSPTIIGEFTDRGAGGETGVVPVTSTHAFVCLLPTTGAAAQWTYEATPPKKKKKGK